jgi:hypothetical protein
MVLLLLIGYVLLAAKQRWTVDVSLSALVSVLVFLLGLLILDAAGEAATREEIQVALLR